MEVMEFSKKSLSMAYKAQENVGSFSPTMNWGYLLRLWL